MAKSRILSGKRNRDGKLLSVRPAASAKDTGVHTGATVNWVNDQNARLTKWLGLSQHAAGKVRSSFDVIELSETGITKRSIDQLTRVIGISKKMMAENILHYSVKTFERKAALAKLDKRTSSHAIEIAKVFQHVIEVFKDEDKAREWIGRENKALSNKKPVELFDTLTGLSMVDDILTRIEEGVYS